MGINQDSPKSSYYKLVRKELKKSYENIISNEFNNNFSLQVSKFGSERKKKQRYNIKEGEILDWKIYLLNQFYSKNEKGWKNSLFNFIRNEHEYNVQNYEIYFIENEIFISQFSLLINPKLYLKTRNDDENPILFLFSPEELKEYSENSIKMTRKHNKDEGDISHSINKSYEAENNNDDDDNLIEFEENINQRPKSKSLTINKSMKSFYSYENLKGYNLKNINEINSYKIREHITLIRSQLNKDDHPISKILKKFSDDYIKILKKRYKSAKESKDHSQINSIKAEIIKDIQNFIAIISVGLKLFYSKTINYEYFVSEKDEFINLICYFLFKDEEFYINIFKFFELSNEEKKKNLKLKKIELGELAPEDFEVSPQFCLNNVSKELKEKKLYNNKEILNDKRKKAEIVDYFEKLDFTQEIFNNSVLNNTYCIEGIKNINKLDKKKNYKSYYYDYKTEFKSKKKKKNIIIDENSLDPTKTISSYKDFSEQFNSLNETLIEKYEFEMNNNPSQLNIPKLENSEKTDENIPYSEAIKYIQTIKDYNAPLDKLTIIALASVLITDDINNFWKGGKNLKDFLTITADDLMAIFLYMVYNMELPSIYTELDFIKYFTGSTTKQSMIGYYYTTIEGCLAFIMSVKTKEDIKKKII